MNDTLNPITKDEHIALCAVAGNIAMGRKYQDIARDLIKRGLIEVHTVWQLTASGYKAAGIEGDDDGN